MFSDELQAMDRVLQALRKRLPLSGWIDLDTGVYDTLDGCLMGTLVRRPPILRREED